MKNILYLHAGAEMYGADKILLELVTGIDKSKYHPIVVLPEHGILEEKLLEKKIETYVIDYPILRRKYFNLKGIFHYFKNYFSSSRKIEELIQNKKIDLIHVNTTAVLEGIYLKKKLNVKLIWHVHEIILSPKFVYRILSYLIANYSDKCVAVSKAVQSHLLKTGYFKNNQVGVIYNGVDSTQFSPYLDSSYLNDEWNIPNNAIKVGMIGRINAWKGQEDFLEALSPLLETNKNLYLFIVGSAFSGQEWREKHLKEKINGLKNNKRIIYSEFRSDNNYIQNFLDVLILPSTNPDPLPTVVLEAMASGTAVVGYNHGGITEMIIDGEDGLLASPNDISSLREKVRTVIDDDMYIEYGDNARKRLEKHFSLNKFIETFSKCYDSLEG